MRPKIDVQQTKLVLPDELTLNPTFVQSHQKYKGAFYALIGGLTTGEAKCVVRSIREKGWESDGFLAMAMLQARYDANTAASLLQCVMEVVSPATIKNHQGIAKGITEWEVRVDGLKMKHDESLSAPSKLLF